MEIKHRGGATTAETYGGIPVHAAPGVHGAVEALLKSRLQPGAHVADFGAGQGALSQRLADAGFKVTAIDASDRGWRAPGVECRVCDLDGDWQDVQRLGPFDAVVAVEVIEHLENPRDFLRRLTGLSQGTGFLLVITTPNPLDTFSSICHFTRGHFNWFSSAHYEGGGHISILPFWLIDKHLEFLAQPRCEWHFHSPFQHKSSLGQFAYRLASILRRAINKSGRTDYFDGETALGSTFLKSAGTAGKSS